MMFLAWLFAGVSVWLLIFIIMLKKRELEEILKEKYELPLIADIKINSKEF
jgi:hypothetical protein